jgi:hypothetical protein
MEETGVLENTTLLNVVLPALEPGPIDKGLFVLTFDHDCAYA